MSYARIAFPVSGFFQQGTKVDCAARAIKLRRSCGLGYEDCDRPTNTAVKARSSNHVSRNLDEIDLKILTEIQADGRITNVELAKRVGISPPTCLRRVPALGA